MSPTARTPLSPFSSCDFSHQMITSRGSHSHMIFIISQNSVGLVGWTEAQHFPHVIGDSDKIWVFFNWDYSHKGNEHRPIKMISFTKCKCNYLFLLAVTFLSTWIFKREFGNDCFYVAATPASLNPLTLAGSTPQTSQLCWYNTTSIPSDCARTGPQFLTVPSTCLQLGFPFEKEVLAIKQC